MFATSIYNQTNNSRLQSFWHSHSYVILAIAAIVILAIAGKKIL